MSHSRNEPIVRKANHSDARSQLSIFEHRKMRFRSKNRGWKGISKKLNPGHDFTCQSTDSQQRAPIRSLSKWMLMMSHPSITGLNDRANSWLSARGF